MLLQARPDVHNAITETVVAVMSKVAHESELASEVDAYLTTFTTPTLCVT